MLKKIAKPLLLYFCLLMVLVVWDLRDNFSPSSFSRNALVVTPIYIITTFFIIKRKTKNENKN